MAKGLGVDTFTPVAALVAIIGPVLTWLIARRKVAVDESAVVFQRWKDLTDRMEAMAKSHTAEMEGLRNELRMEREENASLRRRVKELEDQVAGLERKMIQNSLSTVARIDKAGPP